MIKLFGNPFSTCTRKVLMTLEETKTPFEMNVVDFMKGEHKQPANVARQWFGRMPSIEDDGFSMFESRAIARYIAEKAGSTLVPKDLKERAVMEQWISVETSELTPAAMKFVYKHVFNREVDDATIATATEGLDKTCQALSKQLEKRTYLTGETFTIADICYMPYIGYAMTTPAKATFEKYPHVTSWWGRISERPSWQKVAANKAG